MACPSLHLGSLFAVIRPPDNPVELTVIRLDGDGNVELAEVGNGCLGHRPVGPQHLPPLPPVLPVGDDDAPMPPDEGGIASDEGDAGWEEDWGHGAIIPHPRLPMQSIRSQAKSEKSTRRTQKSEIVGRGEQQRGREPRRGRHRALRRVRGRETREHVTQPPQPTRGPEPIRDHKAALRFAVHVHVYLCSGAWGSIPPEQKSGFSERGEWL